jgi:hypothetical protein
MEVYPGTTKAHPGAMVIVLESRRLILEPKRLMLELQRHHRA